MNSRKDGQNDGYKLSATFDTHKEFNEYIKTEKISFAIEKSSLIKCSICNSSTHQMRYKIARCNDKSCNSENACERQIKLLYCQKRETVVYFFKGNHNADDNVRQPHFHGMSQKAKEKVEDLIFNYDTRPKRIHIKMTKQNEKNKIEILF